MIFGPPRLIAIDDKAHHLEALQRAFQQLGAPCLGIQFRAETELDPKSFRGVRGLFLDLHLIDGVMGTDNRRHYAQIAAILEDNIAPLGGPFILVIWTEHAQLATELQAYLDENLLAEKPWTRPLGVLSLPKEAFINVQDGAAKSADGLRDAVIAAVQSNPQLAALLNWEADVHVAAGETLSALLGLVPEGERSSAAFSPALDGVLSRLASETVGRPNVDADPRAAIGAALAPILADRIQNQGPDQAAAALWSAAVTRHGDKALAKATPQEAGAINRMLHLALPVSEAIKPTDWGAVVEFPVAWWTDQELQARLGVSLGQLLGEEFKLGKEVRPSCRPRLVRIGANCDHAQGRRGPLTYLVGLEMPHDIARKADASGKVRPPASEWESPVFQLVPAVKPFRLHINTRYPITLAAAACDAWAVQYRLREQLCMHLITFANDYASRPAIVQLPT